MDDFETHLRGLLDEERSFTPSPDLPARIGKRTRQREVRRRAAGLTAGLVVIALAFAIPISRGMSDKPNTNQSAARISGSSPRTGRVNGGPPLTITTPNPSIVGGSTVTMEIVGTSEPGATVFESGGPSTTADATGNWKITVYLSQVGPNTVKISAQDSSGKRFVAKDSSGNWSPWRSITIYRQESPTSTPPTT